MSKALEKVSQCEKIIGYQFQEKRHCVEALFTYPGACLDLGSTTMIEKNDKLGIFGEIVLQSHFCQQWLNAKMSPKDWGSIRQDTLGNKNLGSLGKDAGLDPCVVLNPGATSISENTMATTLKAIFGAVKLDGGDAAVAQVANQLKLHHDSLPTETSSPPPNLSS